MPLFPLLDEDEVELDTVSLLTGDAVAAAATAGVVVVLLVLLLDAVEVGCKNTSGRICLTASLKSGTVERRRESPASADDDVDDVTVADGGTLEEVDRTRKPG